MFLPGESQGQGSLMGCCLWGHTESDMAEEDLEALDAAVTGNRIDAPSRPQPKEERKNKKGKKNKEERYHP